MLFRSEESEALQELDWRGVKEICMVGAHMNPLEFDRHSPVVSLVHLDIYCRKQFMSSVGL